MGIQFEKSAAQLVHIGSDVTTYAKDPWRFHVVLAPNYTRLKILARRWWLMPLIPAHRRQRQVDL